MSPTFSILVPTRQRPDTLEHTLASLLVQPGDDYEIVVADNCGDEAVQRVVLAAQAGTSKVRHTRTDRIVPMAENWERGLLATSGRYVTVVGDDDALLPSAIPRLRAILAKVPVEVVSWDCHTYWWPDTIVHWNRNRLFVMFADRDPELRQSAPMLKAFYGPLGFGSLPMIYNALVSRDLIERVRKKHGRYFTPADMAPDVTSGILNLLMTEQYAHCFNPLAVRGNSKNSTGTATWARSLGAERRQEYLKEEGKTLEQMTHEAAVASPNLTIYIANLKLRCKDVFFPGRDDVQVDLQQVVRDVIANLNFEPEAYAANLADAMRLADKIGFVVDPSSIPVKADRKPGSAQGPFSSGFATGVAVNCDTAGIADVAAAARLAEALSPVPAELARSGDAMAGGVGYAHPLPAKRDAAAPETWGPVTRNEPCPCGSGKRFKACHGVRT